jgi:hypothetical protein
VFDHPSVVYIRQRIKRKLVPLGSDCLCFHRIQLPFLFGCSVAPVARPTGMVGKRDDNQRVVVFYRNDREREPAQEKALRAPSSRYTQTSVSMAALCFQAG